MKISSGGRRLDQMNPILQILMHRCIFRDTNSLKHLYV